MLRGTRVPVLDQRVGVISPRTWRPSAFAVSVAAVRVPPVTVRRTGLVSAHLVAPAASLTICGGGVTVGVAAGAPSAAWTAGRVAPATASRSSGATSTVRGSASKHSG